MEQRTNQLFWGTTKFWWAILLIGVLLIPCGCWLIFAPLIGYVTTTTILLWLLILFGVIQLTVAFSTPREVPGWGWWLGGGIIDIFIGFMMLGNINLSAIILPYFFAFIFLYKGVMNLISAFSSISRHKSWWLYMFNGLILLILSCLFFISPFTAAIAIDYLFGIAFIYWGFSLIFFAFDLRPHKRLPGNQPETDGEKAETANDNGNTL